MSPAMSQEKATLGWMGWSFLIVGAVLQTLVPLVIFGFARIWRYPTIESAANFDNRAAAAAAGR